MTLERLSLDQLNHPEAFGPPKSAYQDLDSKLPPGSPSGSIGEERSLDYRDYESKRRALNQVLKKLSGKKLPGKEHIGGYIRHKYRCNFNPKTLLTTFTTVEFFVNFLKQTGKSHLEQITRHDLEAFIEHEQDRGLKISTVRTRLAQLRAFIDFLTEVGVVDPSVLGRKMRLKVPESLPRSIDPEDVNRLLSVRGNSRDRAMILVLLRTGMRIGELLNTKVSDVNLREQKIMIYEGAKNRRGRVVYFTDDARDALKAWLRERDPEKHHLFYAQGRSTMTYGTARVRFNRYLQQARVSHKGYSLHCLRHTYATELLNARMQLQCLQALLGHSNIEMTRRYARLMDKTLEEEYFRAMALIERGQRDDHYQLNCELPTTPQETQLLSPHREDLYEHP